MRMFFSFLAGLLAALGVLLALSRPQTFEDIRPRKYFVPYDED